MLESNVSTRTVPATPINSSHAHRLRSEGCGCVTLGDGTPQLLVKSAASRRPPVWAQTPPVSTLLEAWRELKLPVLRWAHATWALALLLLLGFVNLAVTFPEGPPHAAHQLGFLVTLQVRRTQKMEQSAPSHLRFACELGTTFQ